MKDKIHKLIMLILFGAILISLPVLTFIFMPTEARPFSENENRYLSTLPAVTFENFKNEKLMTGIETWFSDRFFGRENWIKMKNGLERLAGKTNVNGIFTGGGRMIEIWEGYNKEHIDKNLSAINKFAAKNPDANIYFMLAPTSQEIYSYLMPSTAPIGSESELIEYCRDNLECSTINVTNMMKKHSDEYIYYRTDHHWTSLGAYLAYYEIADAMGLKPLELSQFDIEHASSDFRGTLYSKTLDDGIAPDVIDFYHPKETRNISMSVNDGKDVKVYDELYLRNYLDVKDKYSSFTGPNVPLITIETDIEGPSLLVIKDSYAHSLLPFLTNHYSKITVIDFRVNNVPLTSLVNLSDYDSILILYNAITFSSDTGIRKINMN